MRIPFARRPQPFDLVIASGFVAAITLVFVPFRASLGSEQWGWPYLLVVGVTAGVLGVWPAILSALLAFLLWNYLFIEPYYTLHVSSSGDLSHLLTFLVVATLVGLQTGRLKEALREKDIQASRTAALYRLSSSIALGAQLNDIAQVVENEIRSALSVTDVRIRIAHADDSRATVIPQHTAVIDLNSASGGEGSLELDVDEPLNPDDLVFVESMAHLVAVALENNRMNAFAIQTSAAQEAERLRTALISSVSHELKTPVASLMARVTDLLTRDAAPSPSDLSEALEAMTGDLERLNRSIGNLLEASRLEAQAWTPAPALFEPGEMIGAVIRHFAVEQRTRIRFDVEANVPQICADFAQVSRALTHIVDNALRYSEREVVIGSAGHPRDGRISVWVADEGPGLLDKDRDKVFDRFYRGSAGMQSPSSTGLGLSLAREFVVANGGTLDAENLRPHGLRLTMTLPADNPSPTG